MIALCFLFIGQAHAGAHSEPCSILESSAKIPKLLSRLVAEVPNASTAGKKFIVPHSTVREFLENIDVTPKGLFPSYESVGVQAVATEGGKRRAVKIFNSDIVLSDVMPTIIIQDILARIDITPRVIGIVTGRDLIELVRRSPISETRKKKFEEEGTTNSLALIMEEVVGGWNFMKDSGWGDRFPAFARDIDLQRVIEFIRFTERALNELNIEANDTQFVIRPNGEVFLIDITRFSWYSPEGKKYEGLPGVGSEKDRTKEFTPNNFSLEIEWLERLIKKLTPTKTPQP